MPHLTHDAIAIEQPAPDGTEAAPSVAREAGRGLEARWAVAAPGQGQPANRPERLQSATSSVRQ
jgi:hypothetical protein